MPSSGVQTCARSEEHTSELQSHDNLVCRLLLEKKKLDVDRQGRPAIGQASGDPARVRHRTPRCATPLRGSASNTTSSPLLPRPFFFFKSTANPRYSPSFPTRRPPN